MYEQDHGKLPDQVNLLDTAEEKVIDAETNVEKTTVFYTLYSVKGKKDHFYVTILNKEGLIAAIPPNDLLEIYFPKYLEKKP